MHREHTLIARVRRTLDGESPNAGPTSTDSPDDGSGSPDGGDSPEGSRTGAGRSTWNLPAGVRTTRANAWANLCLALRTDDAGTETGDGARGG